MFSNSLWCSMFLIVKNQLLLLHLFICVHMFMHTNIHTYTHLWTWYTHTWYSCGDPSTWWFPNSCTMWAQELNISALTHRAISPMCFLSFKTCSFLNIFYIFQAVLLACSEAGGSYEFQGLVSEHWLVGRGTDRCNISNPSHPYPIPGSPISANAVTCPGRLGLKPWHHV